MTKVLQTRQERLEIKRHQFAKQALASLAIFLVIMTALYQAAALRSSNLVPSQETPNIQAPLLTQKVILDGRMSGTEEWSDVPGLNLSLSCSGKRCSQAPVRQVQSIIWIKHDGKNIYFLYRLDWPKERIDPAFAGEAAVEYGWNSRGLPGLPINGMWSFYDSSYCGATYDENKKTVVPAQSWSDDWYDMGAVSLEDEKWSPPGRNDVQGIVTHDGEHFWFEFRKPLNSGDGRDWNFTAGNTYGVLGADGFLQVGFGTGNPRVRYYQPITLTLLGSTTLRTSITTSSTAIWLTSKVSTSLTSGSAASLTATTSVQQALLTIMPFGALGMIGLAAVVVVVSSAIVLSRRKKVGARLVTAKAVQTEELQEKVAERSVLPAKPVTPSRPVISTGYSDLDGTLSGGIPEGFAIVLVSPSYDERDLLLRKIIDSALSSGRPAFYISNDIERTHDLLARYPRGFYAFSSQAEKIAVNVPNLYKIPGVENLSEANISLALAIKDARAREKAAKMILIIDILSDLILRYKAITTRRWLSDFVGKRKVEGFTTLATLNPLTGSKEDSQTVIDFFDGVIEIFEKELKERSRRFVIVKKMYGKKYSESELMLDKDKLF